MQKTPLMLEVEKRIGEKLESYLPRMYSEEWKSSIYLGGELEVNSMTVRRWLVKFGITLRDGFDYTKRRVRKPPKGAIIYYYNLLRKPVKEVAKERGVCPKTFYRWMDKLGVERRHGSETFFDNDFVKPSKQELENLLCKHSNKEVASRFRINPRTLRTWKQKLGLHKSRKSKYDYKSLRKKMLDSLLEQIRKEPRDLIADDFKELYLNGRSYRGLLDWYISHFGYGRFYQIKEHFIMEFYDDVGSR